jgi:predicted nucleotidyltransferase component of viral defense system
MRTLLSRIPLGREFILRHNMELDLGRGLGNFEVETKRDRARFSRRIQYKQREVGSKRSIAEVQKTTEAVGEEDIRDAIEAMHFAEFGGA